MNLMEVKLDDGGRAKAGYKGVAGDCVCRAVAIASGIPYAEVYEAINANAKTERRGRRRQSSARSGVRVTLAWFKRYMNALGFTWVPTMGIGTGCTVHLRAGELPMGRLVVALSRHYVAVIDGVIHDLYDPSREGTRCVYGYYRKAAI